jgi:holo-[acyl-carrier protein] synthase
MIFGIGADLVAIPRIEALLARRGRKAAERILSPRELVQFDGLAGRAQAAFLAKRWAAKEAFAKALGTGFRGVAAPSAIGVAHDNAGRPAFELSAALQARMDAESLAAQLSLSDEKTMALAFAVLEKTQTGG